MSFLVIILHEAIGAWRSPEARLHGVQEVLGSNPGAPTALKLTRTSNNQGWRFFVVQVVLAHRPGQTPQLVDGAFVNVA
jgi:hypothetical protein